MTARLRVLPVYLDKGELTHYVILDNVGYGMIHTEQVSMLSTHLAENGGQLLVFAWPVELPEVDVPPLPDNNAEREEWEGLVQRWQELTDRWCEAMERSAAEAAERAATITVNVDGNAPGAAEVLRSLREAGMGAGVTR